VGTGNAVPLISGFPRLKFEKFRETGNAVPAANLFRSAIGNALRAKKLNFNNITERLLTLPKVSNYHTTMFTINIGWIRKLGIENVLDSRTGITFIFDNRRTKCFNDEI
jgi:hypothetical protein